MGCEQVGRCWLWYQEVANHARCGFVDVPFVSTVVRRLIGFVVPPEDELVSLDDLQEKIAEFDDYVQSSDIAAMQSALDMFRCYFVLMNVSRALNWNDKEVFGESTVCLVRKMIVVTVCQMYDMNSICSGLI